MRASCQFGRDHAYLDGKFEQGHDKLLVPQFRRLPTQVLTLVMSVRDCVRPYQDHNVIAVVDDVVGVEKRGEVGDNVEERERAVSHSFDARSC